MGRVAGVSCGAAWGQTFGFDSFGNIQKSGSQSFGATYNSKNQISTNINFTPDYDLDGNLLDDPISGSRGVNSFDVEGRAVTLEGVGVVYDALGRAVEAATSGGTVEFVYGPGGGKLAVMNGQSLVRADVPIPGGGEAVYNASGFAYFRHADHLGSSRLATTVSRTLYASTAYAPFGEAYGAAGTQDRSFTGQKQDIDSSHSGGQYDMLYRDLNAIQGRWWTPDPSGLAAVNPQNPQSWDRYGYVNGRPLTSIDALGLLANGGCIPIARLRVNNPNGNLAAASGPYDPQQAGGNNWELTGCADISNFAVGGWGGTWLDGAEVGGFMAGQLSTQSSSYTYQCFGFSCTGDAPQNFEQFLQDMPYPNAPPCSQAQNISNAANAQLAGDGVTLTPLPDSNFTLGGHLNAVFSVSGSGAGALIDSINNAPGYLGTSLDPTGLRFGTFESLHLPNDEQYLGKNQIVAHIDVANGNGLAGPVHWAVDVGVGTILAAFGLGQALDGCHQQ